MEAAPTLEVQESALCSRAYQNWRPNVFLRNITGRRFAAALSLAQNCHGVALSQPKGGSSEAFQKTQAAIPAALLCCLQKALELQWRL
ncbi:hypothetical protein AK812_SmicGene23123 [Symbiodinium microadriaticum]|uniref:Uncharacterized protein n=1 Tax=Symbiodinium microadriaticum TaxID=2951 RepID=A0A1Q9DI18_SYMMI|nr:hypothetical protein AK812_SmicGene23123 [Symbiodinium microadriaticum]